MTHTDPPTLDYASPPKAAPKPAGPRATMLFCAGTLTAFSLSVVLVGIVHGRRNWAWTDAAAVIPLLVAVYGFLFAWAALIRRYPGVLEFDDRPLTAYVAGVVAVGLPIVVVATDAWVHGRVQGSWGFCFILSALLTGASPWAVYRGRVY